MFYSFICRCLSYHGIGRWIIGNAVGFNEPHKHPVVKTVADGTDPQGAAELIEQAKKEAEYEYFNQHHWFFIIGDVRKSK